jgi:hypothetical protein
MFTGQECYEQVDSSLSIAENRTRLPCPGCPWKTSVDLEPVYLEIS